MYHNYNNGSIDERLEYSNQPIRESLGDFSQRPLRERLIVNGYKDPLKRSFFEAPKSPLGQEKINESLCKSIEAINSSYNSRGKSSSGLWYPMEYIEQKRESPENLQLISYMSHPEYWDLKIDTRFQEDANNHKPSELLDAFFQGPSFADCGSAIQALLYKTVEESVGTEVFNEYFNKALTPFIISRSLYQAMPSGNKDLYQPLFDMNHLDTGNPIFHLLDTKFFDIKVNEENISPGDIVYIKGVNKYTKKHLAGSAAGWNVICTSKNEEGENLYLGFGPNQFDKHKTLKEISRILIDGYNADQSINTMKLIADTNTETHLQNSAKRLKDDKVAYTYPIDGIRHVVRLSSQKIQKYILDKTKQANLWYNIKPSQKTFDKTNLETLNLIEEIPSENINSSFGNYKIDNELRTMLHEKSRQFAEAVIKQKNKPKKETLGLIMTGTAGIGKTHLSTAVAKAVSATGLKVLFVNTDTVRDTYQKLCKKKIL